jgi:hypothetical protein
VKSRWLLTLMLGWLLISAPTPGAVGSCGADKLDVPSNFSSYCQNRGQLVCVRRFLRKEITADSRDSCRWAAIDACALRSFASRCTPTLRQTDACLTALSSFDTLSTPDDAIPECDEKILCTATPSQASDAGVDAQTPDRSDEDAGSVNP